MADKMLVERFMDNLGLVFERDASKLTRDIQLKKDLNISSTKRFMIIGSIEELFGAEVQYCQIKDCVTIGDLLDLVGALPA